MIYIARKILTLIFSLAVIVSFVFFLSRLLPQNLYNLDEINTDNLKQKEIAIKSIQKKQGLDKPLFYFSIVSASKDEMERIELAFSDFLPRFNWSGTNNQYHDYFSGILQFHFGFSFGDERPVSSILKEAILITISYTVITFLLVWFFGILGGIYLVAIYKSKIKYIIIHILYILDAIPLFLLSLFLLAVFSGTGFFSAAWEPADTTGVFNKLINNLTGFLLPIFAIFIAGLPYATLQSFTAINEAMSFDYILTAKAKGLGTWAIIFKHALRNSLIPLITLITESFPIIITGSVVAEIIFGIPGMGRLLVSSIYARDYPVIMAIVIFISFIKIFSIMIADVFYRISDPRIRI